MPLFTIVHWVLLKIEASLDELYSKVWTPAVVPLHVWRAELLLKRHRDLGSDDRAQPSLFSVDESPVNLSFLPAPGVLRDW